ncbi:hypothetical protein CK203_019857 [Vitis vinifera]|uniref:tRNA (adenine(58)-N(1))-methyltransferase non-catalytic subunit TRM6 n=1 Tax=Vitis vinifera TaxID=29760 RepID=A0A438J2Y2_VITVI|nr:hypothetical protein CK203_019857 [Vitis vinifera]
MLLHPLLDVVGEACHLTFSGEWYIQVLPSRTHPCMQMSAFGGYILSGTRICSSDSQIQKGAGCAVARCRNWFHDHQHDMKTSSASISCLLQTGAVQLGQSARVGLLFC